MIASELKQSVKRCYVSQPVVPARGHLLISKDFLCFWRRATIGEDIKVRFRIRRAYADNRSIDIPPPISRVPTHRPTIDPLSMAWISIFTDRMMSNSSSCRKSRGMMWVLEYAECVRQSTRPRNSNGLNHLPALLIVPLPLTLQSRRLPPAISAICRRETCTVIRSKSTLQTSSRRPRMP